MDTRFLPVRAYQPDPQGGYRILPFRFMRWPDGTFLVTNDVGEYLFLDRQFFTAFVHHALVPSDTDYSRLKSKHFLLDSPSTLPIELLATKYRTKKAFLDGFTKLHLFVVTLRCDHSCHYCQVSRVSPDRMAFDMTEETADRAIDLMFASPSPSLKVEFQGGEPLLNFDLIRHVVDRVNCRNETEQRNLEYVVATNLSSLTDEMLEFFLKYSMLVSTSLDGPENVHNANRPRRGGDSYQVTTRNIQRVREALGWDRVAAVMTASELSLRYATEIVDEYVRQGFDSIFLRPISPYGFAVRTLAASRYGVEQFLDFYREALAHIFELNRQGIRFTEVYAQILLRKILTPFTTGYVDLQSPSGAAIGAVAYNYDGDVYASDEGRMLAEMGDRSFRLGNVHTDSYEAIFGGPIVRGLVENSCVESLPGCAECAFAPYCGADPVFHWATQGDPIGHRPTSAFCAKNMGIFRHLFGLLRDGDSFVERLLATWVTDGRLEHPEQPEASA